MSKPFRRVVTGHDAAGRAVIHSDAPPERVKVLAGNGPTFYEVWNTRETPARIDRASGEPFEEGLVLTPPPRGTRIRVLDIPPEGPELEEMSAARAREHFAEIGAPEASTHPGTASSRHPFMHRTQTIDYGIVLEGEITLLVDEGETTVRAGDIVIQRGTNHAWANRSGRNCRIAFVLIDGVYTEGLAWTLEAHAS
ncbi:MAG TPA: cupin domain-containing protein [Steroidobacteraceae bacterium]|nr:cupin domain-containing protein [Steroidobacteraceae bacterium]